MGLWSYATAPAIHEASKIFLPSKGKSTKPVTIWPNIPPLISTRWLISQGLDGILRGPGQFPIGKFNNVGAPGESSRGSYVPIAKECRGAPEDVPDVGGKMDPQGRKSLAGGLKKAENCSGREQASNSGSSRSDEEQGCRALKESMIKLKRPNGETSPGGISQKEAEKLGRGCKTHYLNSWKEYIGEEFIPKPNIRRFRKDESTSKSIQKQTFTGGSEREYGARESGPALTRRIRRR